MSKHDHHTEPFTGRSPIAKEYLYDKLVDENESEQKRILTDATSLGRVGLRLAAFAGLGELGHLRRERRHLENHSKAYDAGHSDGF